MSSPTPFLSTKTIRQRSVLLAVLFLVCLLAIFPVTTNAILGATQTVLGIDLSKYKTTQPFVLGLDLQGGTHLEYEADVKNVPASDRPEALNGVRDVIERRVNSLGVSEPLVQTTQAGDAWRVTVELAGIRDVNQAIDLIGKTPILTFKEQSNEAPRELTAAEKQQMDKNNVDAQKKAADFLAQAKQPGVDFSQLVKDHSDSPSMKANGGETGFMHGKPEWNSIYQEIHADPVGLVDRVITRDRSFAVVKVEERKEISKEATGRHILIGYQGAQQSTSTSTKEQARALIDDLKKRATPANFEALAKQYSTEPDAKTTGGDLGWFEQGGGLVESFEKPFFALEKNKVSDVVETPFGFHLILKTDERPVYDVRARVLDVKKFVKEDFVPATDGWKETKLTGKQLQSARVDFDQRTGAVEVALQFNDEGKALFGEITRRNLGKPVGIFIDNQLISAPTVQSEITGGQAVITGSYTLETARELARNLQAGALPVPITLIAQQTVGPSLGSDSLAASLKAGLAGFLLVTLFMVLIYRLPGLLAIVSLGLYAALSLTIFRLVPVTLTLSGIAGFILSLGIAVDANVLVFERLKEELRAGKALPIAMEEAFRRAWPSIRDGHITVLISCAVLYWFSSSIIRGFALTLAIGIVISLFTAVVSCRTWLRLLVSTKLSRYGWLFLQKKDPSHS